ncbi:ABC transporter permease [Microbacterium sp. NPDC089318]
MIPFILRRLATGVLLAFLVTVITYWLLSFSFDGVARNIAGNTASAETVAGVFHELGFDRPFLVQYFDWFSGVLRGDFGTSFFSGAPVATAMSTRLSVTLSMVLTALAITVVISVFLGVWAATRGGLVDRVVQVGIMFGYVFPGLLLAIALVYIFAITLHWLPATGYTPFGDDPGAWLRSILLPSIVLAIAGTANLTSQVRGAMIDELRKDYVRTLRTRGVRSRPVVFKHALRNAASPALTVVSLEFLGMFGGAMIIERIFALPGIGSYSYDAAVAGDLPIVLGLTVFIVALVIVINLATDLVNGWLNPKARLV